MVDCHDLHAWTITSGMNVVSAHVVLAEGADPAVALEALCACLADDFDIEHSTFQLETEDRRRIEQASHARRVDGAAATRPRRRGRGP